MMTTANGLCVSLPTPVDTAAGIKPRIASSAVSSTARKPARRAADQRRHQVFAVAPAIVDGADDEQRRETHLPEQAR